MAIDPYIKKDPNDLIRSGDWNDIQVRARQEIRSHTHQGDADGTPIPRAGIQPNAIDGTRIDPSSKVTVAQLKVVDRDLLVDINTLITRANDFDSRINALVSRATALESTRVNRAGDTITGALRVNGGVQLGGEGSVLELGAGATKDPDGGKIAFRAFSQGLDIVGAGATVADRKITFHAQGGANFLGGASFSGSVQYTGRLSRLDTDEQGSATVRAADFLLGHSGRRGTRVPASPPGRALVDATDTLVLNYGPDWPKTQISGTDSILLSANEVNLANQLKLSGGQLRNASGFAIIQTNSNDWLRINMDQSYPSIALYKPVAVGTGGLAVGSWHQMPQGQLRVSDDTWIGGGLTVTQGTVLSGTLAVGIAAPEAQLHVKSPNELVAKLESHGNRTVIQWERNDALLWDMGVGTDQNNANFWWGDFTAYRMILERGTGNLTITGRLIAAGGKLFLIDHPLAPKEKDLQHAALEGPELGVYYRGEARLDDGVARVELPGYFEALVRKEDRTVQLTPKLEGKGPVSSLAASGVEEGRFVVRATDRNNPSQAFFWEVKGVRADVDRLQPEVLKRKG